MKPFHFICAASAPLFTLACTENATAPQAPIDVTVDIVVTTGMIADAVRAITNEDAITLTQLMGPGSDPHGYPATREDFQALEQADLILYSGHHLEGTLHDVLHHSEQAFAVAEAIPASYYIVDGEATDPHMWNNLEAWAYAVEATATQLRAANIDVDQAQLDAYLADLQGLTQYGQAIIATLPEERRILLTAHDAFAYFGEHFGIDVEAFQGISTADEVGLHRRNALVELIITRNIPVIFPESSVTEANLAALVADVNGREGSHQVRLYETALFSDAMGETGSHEGTLIGMIEHNLNHIVRAMGGIVPEGGYEAWHAAQIAP